MEKHKTNTSLDGAGMFLIGLGAANIDKDLLMGASSVVLGLVCVAVKYYVR